MEIKDGGPAFPLDYRTIETGKYPAYREIVAYHHQKGLSLRDWFAGKAMQGDWASQDITGNGVFLASMDDEALLEHAKFYCRMADAMLEAREA